MDELASCAIELGHDRTLPADDNQNEPPFLVVQVVSLVAFFALITLALKRFREEPFDGA